MFVHLCEKGFVDLHPGVRALRQRVAASPPGVVNGWVGVGDAAKKHRPLKVELLLRLSNTLVNRYHRVIQVCGGGEQGGGEEGRGSCEINGNEEKERKVAGKEAEKEAMKRKKTSEPRYKSNTTLLLSLQTQPGRLFPPAASEFTVCHIFQTVGSVFLWWG